MELSWGQMGNLDIDLIGVALADRFDAICLHGGPVAPLSEYALRQGYAVHVRTTVTSLQALHDLVCFLPINTAEQKSFTRYCLVSQELRYCSALDDLPRDSMSNFDNRRSQRDSFPTNMGD